MNNNIKMKIIFSILLTFIFSFSVKAQTLLQQSFIGSVTGDEIFFNIYLPIGYETATTGFPVVYHLHGINGSQGGNQNNIIPDAFVEALQSGVISEQYIIVFPNGLTNSMWANSKSGHKPVETHIIQELIPHVDTHFNTLSTRENRYIQGFSMGGFGAAKFIAKYPNLFQSAVIFDGALHTWETFNNRHPNLATEIFGDDEAYFDQYSPWSFFEQNASELANSVCIRITVGSLVILNQPFRDSLTAWGIPFEYIETNCQHILSCLLNQDGVNSAAFQENCSNILGVESYNIKTALVVYPNPTKGLLRVEYKTNYQKIEISIFTIIGERVLTKKNQTEIDISSLSNGIYYLRAKVDDKIGVKKILKIE
jgi:endo-1,4-beta-xylanase